MTLCLFIHLSICEQDYADATTWIFLIKHNVAVPAHD